MSTKHTGTEQTKITVIAFGVVAGILVACYTHQVDGGWYGLFMFSGGIIAWCCYSLIRNWRRNNPARSVRAPRSSGLESLRGIERP